MGLSCMSSEICARMLRTLSDATALRYHNLLQYVNDHIKYTLVVAITLHQTPIYRTINFHIIYAQYSLEMG
jgi:hypothetical protein